MIMKIMMMVMKIILWHSILPGYTLYIIADTSQSVFRPLNPRLESKWLLNFQNPCNILQDWHQNMIRSVQPDNHRIAILLVVPVIVWLHRSDHVCVPILKNLTSPIFSNISVFGPSTASTGPKSSCGPQSVLHEIDHIEQTNNYDLSEKFPTTNFMMKTASLQKVKKN